MNTGGSGETSGKGPSRGWEKGPLTLSFASLATEVLQRQTPVAPSLCTGCKVNIGPSRASTDGLLCHGTSVGNHSDSPCLHPEAGEVGHCCSSQMEQKEYSHRHLSTPHHLSIDYTPKPPVTLSHDIQLLFSREKGGKKKIKIKKDVLRAGAR